MLKAAIAAPALIALVALAGCKTNSMADTVKSAGESVADRPRQRVENLRVDAIDIVGCEIHASSALQKHFQLNGGIGQLLGRG